MKKIIIFLISSIYLGFSFNAFTQDVDDLVYMTEEYPPLNYLEDGEIKGLSVELLKLIWKKMGYPEQKIVLFPWARGYKLVQEKKNHVLFSMVRTKEREPLFKWVGPIVTTEYVLVGLTKNKIKINSLEDAKKYSIGTVREDATEQILIQAGFSKIQPVSKIKLNIKKLKAGRIDLLIYDKRSIYNEIKDLNYDAKEFEAIFKVDAESDHFAFHRGTPDLLIKKFQKALDSLADEHQAILKKYLWK